jgi:phage tail protein X
MAVTYVSYITQDADRWDEIAYRYLGDPFNISPIIDANPSVPIYPLLPAGIVLFIPVFDPQPLIEFNNLPPWRRPQNNG